MILTAIIISITHDQRAIQQRLRHHLPPAVPHRRSSPRSMYPSAYPVGALYINWGSYLANESGRHWDYVENLPLASFTIVVGGMIVLAVVWLRITMNSKMGPSGEFAYWFVTVMMGVLNFAVAFLMIREFVYSDKRHTKLGIAIPSYCTSKLIQGNLHRNITSDWLMAFTPSLSFCRPPLSWPTWPTTAWLRPALGTGS